MLPSQELAKRIADGAIQADPAQAALARDFDALLHRLLAKKRQPSWLRRGKNKADKGLYIWGGVGRGKSMLMDSFFHLASTRHGLRLARFHFHDFMRTMHGLVHKQRQAGKADPTQGVMQQLTKGAAAVCFDEMEVRDIADAMIIARVMSAYMDTGGVLIATSNRHPDGLYENGLQRERFIPFINSLKSRCEVIEMAGALDWRRELLAGEAGWHTPLGKTATAKMAAWQNKLACGLPIAEAEVDLGGRGLRVPWVAGGVAAMGFDALCRVPLAAADYLVLAERFSGLLLADIPILSDQLHNEARRFMWLVDAFYDRRRFLLATAATDREGLYGGEVWRAEFPRTVSRMHEMTQLK